MDSLDPEESDYQHTRVTVFEEGSRIKVEFKVWWVSLMRIQKGRSDVSNSLKYDYSIY